MAADPGPLTAAVGLASLAAGMAVPWVGIDDSLDEAAVAGVLGPPDADEPHGGVLGGSPTLFRDYGPTPGAPAGLRVWFEDGFAVAVEIRGARLLDLADLDAVDDPVVEGSAFGEAWRQEIHAERGLVLHRRGHEVALVYGLAPFAADDWATDPLRASGPGERRRS